MHRAVRAMATAAAVLTILSACSSPSPAGVRAKTLNIGAIPDQDPQELQRRYGSVADYLSHALGVRVHYLPVTDYAASVTAFRRGDLDLAFFGGLTGVQARLQVPGAQPIAQRDIDATFRSVFIAGTDSGLDTINDIAGLHELVGHSFTFGSESSTSGRLMPQFFLSKAHVNLTDLKGQVGFSGSHDTTVKLVAAGTYDAGTLSTEVWDARVKARQVPLDKVREIFRTPPYHDYHWVIRPDVDQRFGTGFTERVKKALIAINGSTPQQRQILELFKAGRFISTAPENYTQIEAVARTAGLIK